MQRDIMAQIPFRVMQPSSSSCVSVSVKWGNAAACESSGFFVSECKHWHSENYAVCELLLKVNIHFGDFE
jgi:hypothetical protein